MSVNLGCINVLAGHQYWLMFALLTAIGLLANKIAATDVYLLCRINFALPKCCFGYLRSDSDNRFNR